MCVYQINAHFYDPFHAAKSQLKVCSVQKTAMVAKLTLSNTQYNQNDWIQLDLWLESKEFHWIYSMMSENVQSGYVNQYTGISAPGFSRAKRHAKPVRGLFFQKIDFIPGSIFIKLCLKRNCYVWRHQRAFLLALSY